MKMAEFEVVKLYILKAMPTAEIRDAFFFGDASSTRVEVVLEEPLQRVHRWL